MPDVENVKKFALKLFYKAKNLTIRNVRIKLLKSFYVLLILTIFIRLGYIHFIHQPDYKFHLEKTIKTNLKKSQSRGEIFDRHGNPLAINNPVQSIVYYYDPHRSIDGMYQIANKLAKQLDVDVKKLTTQDQVDLYRRLYDLSDDDVVDEANLRLLTLLDKKEQVIFNRMAESIYGGGVSTIKFDATEQEVAYVSEHLDILSGVNVETLSERMYPSPLGAFDLLGAISKNGAGFPDGDALRYLARGYNINDRIGLASIEKYYEDYLHGAKANYVQENGQKAHILNEGLQGFDLTLTIDANLTQAIDDLLRTKMMNAKRNNAGAKYLNEGYVVVTNPKNGEILSLNGMIFDENNDLVSHPLGTLLNSFTMGSVVKGATLMTGYQEGVTKFGDGITDAPMIFADGSKKASWSELGYVNDIGAIRSSSNVYFMQQSIRLGGDVYRPRKSLNVNMDAINTYRMSFEKFGLGSPTGIDLAGEQTGMKDPERNIAKLLDFSIGQSDTYTPIQLAQYVSTIANGGNRYALQLLKQASLKVDDEFHQLIYENEPYIMNQIDVDPVAFDRIQEGFRQVLQSSNGTGRYYFQNANYNPAGKTGTAEEFARGKDGKILYTRGGNIQPVHHLTFVGYAPADDPEIAISVVFPQAEMPKQNNPIALEVASEVFKLYFDLQKKAAYPS